MARSIQELETEIRSLSSIERTRLLRGLIADLDADVEADVERAWLDEVEQRHREVKEGVVEPIPATEVFKRVGSRLRK